MLGLTIPHLLGPRIAGLHIVGLGAARIGRLPVRASATGALVLSETAGDVVDGPVEE